MSEVVIDVRGLNYPYLTGVNTVTLHILYNLLNELNSNSGFSISTFGLNSQALTELNSKYLWLKTFINQNQSLSEFLKINSSFTDLSSIINLLYFYAKIQNKSKSNQIIYQSQPKPIALGKNQKFITTFHDLSILGNFNKPGWKHKLQENKTSYKLLVSRADKIIVSSVATGFDIMKYLNVPQEKIKLIYLALPEWNILESNVYSENFNNENSNSKPYFLALSAFEYRKNYHNLLLGWKILNDRHAYFKSDYKLIIAGRKVSQSYFDYLLNLKQKLNLENVDFLIDVTQSRKNELLKNCISLIYTSLYEGFGFPILEAQKFGKSILTSQVSSMPEIGGKGVLLVNPLDASQIADGIYILVADTTFREKLELAGKQNLKRFSWNEYATELPKVFTEIRQ